MKKLISLALSLVLCACMIPSALAAEDDANAGDPSGASTAPAAGIYFAAQNGVPEGACKEADGTLANGTVLQYNGITYTPGEPLTFFYYDGDATADDRLLLTDNNSNPDQINRYNIVGPDIEAVVDGETSFWEITLTIPQRQDPFSLDFMFRGKNMLIELRAAEPAPSLEAGLYYKPLGGAESSEPWVEVNSPFMNTPLVLTPYFERADLAFYFCDGTDYIPVDVIFGNTLTVDPVRVGQTPGCYRFAAYDFCEGKIFYDDDSTQTTYSLDVSTCLPDLAFYAGETISEENFRMYTIAEENTSTNNRFAGYRFAKNLRLLARDPDRLFNGQICLAVGCFQHQYLSDGTEINEIPYTDFDYDWNYCTTSDGGYIDFTLYTNDSDVLCHVPGTYVNVLAPDDDTSLLFHANQQGSFASAKFLPKHLFDELAALNRGVTISSENFEGGVTLDDAVVDTIANAADPVSFCMTANAATQAEKDLIAAALASGETMVDVVDLNLWFGSEPRHELGGQATIKYTADIAAGSSVKVYYLNAEGGLEEMDAEYQNGSIIFLSDHFSKFVLVEVEASSPPTPSYPSSRPSRPAKPAKPAASKFADVAEDYWAKAAIDWAAEQGYVNGTADTEFSPEDQISRQQIWMMLSRVSGKSAADMAAAKSWATANGISDGTNPGAAVTRQQLVTLLYRYALLMGYDVSVGENTNILSYDDVSSVSEYAIPAFRWACGAGVVNGTTESTLSPLGTATRAQFAVMLQRFCDKIG